MVMCDLLVSCCLCCGLWFSVLRVVLCDVSVVCCVLCCVCDVCCVLWFVLCGVCVSCYVIMCLGAVGGCGVLVAWLFGVLVYWCFGGAGVLSVVC